MLYTITVAFCPAAQLARSIVEYRNYRGLYPDQHIVVLGYYPINKKKNNRDIQMLCESLELECWDPGADLGSAQSQNYALERLAIENDDYFINLDPDSRCTDDGWDFALKEHLDSNPDCVLASCWSKLWDPYRSRLEIMGDVGRAIAPMPFNLSMFKCSFLKQIGGLRQLGERWGELEGVFHAEMMRRDKHAVYLMDCLEDESGKFLQDRPLLEYKDSYLRTDGPTRFVGSYEEFLRLKYPHLLEVDTFIDADTVFQ